jgi:hypothetical protein
MTEEKIPVPAAWLADQEKKEERGKLVTEWREHLATKQKEAVDAAPFGRFESRIPLEALKAFTPEERDQLMVHEEQA